MSDLMDGNPRTTNLRSAVMVFALAARRTGAARAERETDKTQRVKRRMLIQGMRSFGMLTVGMKEKEAGPKITWRERSFEMCAHRGLAGSPHQKKKVKM